MEEKPLIIADAIQIVETHFFRHSIRPVIVQRAIPRMFIYYSVDTNTLANVRNSRYLEYNVETILL